MASVFEGINIDWHEVADFYKSNRKSWLFQMKHSDDEFIISKGKLVDVNKSVFEKATNLQIPEGVTSIGEKAFSDCKKLTSITIPESVKRIGKAAFENCRSLTSIAIPESVKSIGGYAFCSCESLTSITIPEGVTSIEESAFNHCKNLTSITIPESVTSIEKDAFSGTLLLENQIGVKYADTWVVGCDTDVTTAEIREGTKIISSFSFSECKSLTSITIPKSVMSIGDGAFSGCKKLENITVEKNNPMYCDVDGVLFNKEQTELLVYPLKKGKRKRYTLPKNVTCIKTDAFEYDISLVFSFGEDSAVFSTWDQNSKVVGLLLAFYNSDSYEERENLFDQMEGRVYKLPLAIVMAVSDEKEDSVFRAYVKKNIKNAVTHLIDVNDLNLLKKLLSLGYVTKRNIGAMITYAQTKKKKKMETLLTEYKNNLS
ncbi:MAG: leucine-rich repeat domain-containing protein [Ruminococcus callidus]|nr:leucine-rich repeat domain-containing protein [Ruminococcus callidus]